MYEIDKDEKIKSNGIVLLQKYRRGVYNEKKEDI